MRQFEAIAQTNDLKTIYRIRSNFAIIWAAGALAIDYGVLPWKKSRLLKAVKKCFAGLLVHCRTGNR